MPKPSSFLLSALLGALTLISLPAWASEKLMVVPFSGQKSQECTRHANKALESAGHPLDKTTKPPTAGNLKEMRSAGSASGVKAFVVGKVALVARRGNCKLMSTRTTASCSASSRSKRRGIQGC
jgi:hypothetical protein